MKGGARRKGCSKRPVNLRETRKSIFQYTKDLRKETMGIIAWLRLFLHYFLLVQARALEEKRTGVIEGTGGKVRWRNQI